MEITLPKKAEPTKPIGLNISAPVDTFAAKPRPKPTLQLGVSADPPKEQKEKRVPKPVLQP
jgi:hypothetical protein